MEVLQYSRQKWNSKAIFETVDRKLLNREVFEVCDSKLLVRDSIMLCALHAIARPSVCPSVRLTGGSVKKVEVWIMKFSPYGSPIPLVFAG